MFNQNIIEIYYASQKNGLNNFISLYKEELFYAIFSKTMLSFSEYSKSFSIFIHFF